jgi:hypothetical protein
MHSFYAIPAGELWLPPRQSAKHWLGGHGFVDGGEALGSFGVLRRLVELAGRVGQK